MTHTDGHLAEPSDREGDDITNFYVSIGGVLKELEVDEIALGQLNQKSLKEKRTAILNALNNIR